MSPSDLQQALADARELGFGGDRYIFPDNHHTGMFRQQRERDQRNEVTPSVLTMDETLPVDSIKSSHVFEPSDNFEGCRNCPKNHRHCHWVFSNTEGHARGYC